MDFSVKVKAELDTSGLKDKLRDQTINVKIGKISGLGDVKKQIEAAAKDVNVTIGKVSINQSAIQSALNKATAGATLKLNNKSNKSNISSSSGSNPLKDLEKLEQQYNKFMTTFTKANGQNSTGMSGLKSQLDQVKVAMDNLKAYSKNDIFDTNGLSKGIAAQKAQLDNIKNSFTGIKDAVKGIETGDITKQIEQINQAFSKMGGDANTELKGKISASISEIQRLQTALTTAMQTGNVDNMAADFAKLQTEIKKVNNEIATTKIKQGGDWIGTDKINDMVAKLQKLNGVDVSGVMAKLQAGLNAGAISPKEWSGITSEFKSLQAEASTLAASGEKVGSSWKSVFAAFTAGFSAVAVINKMSDAVKDMVNNVKNIDSAMVELRKVSDESESTYASYLKSAAKTSKEIGTTMSDYITSTANFKRLGNTFAESQELAKVASVYNIVGDDLSGIDQATEHIISSMYAFGVSANDAISIVDKLNEVSKIVAETYSNVWGLSLLDTISVKG